MEPNYLNLLIQIPLVGAFIWFSLKQQTLFQQSAEKRDAEWRNFLLEQRMGNNEALARLAEEIKQMARLQVEANANLTLHDQRVTMAIPAMQEAVDKLAPPKRRGTS